MNTSHEYRNCNGKNMVVLAAVCAVVCCVWLPLSLGAAYSNTLHACIWKSSDGIKHATLLPLVLCDVYAKHTTLVTLSALVLSQLYARVSVGTYSDSSSMPPLTNKVNSSPSPHSCSCALIDRRLLQLFVSSATTLLHAYHSS
jgi:hypothetical protein